MRLTVEYYKMRLLYFPQLRFQAEDQDEFWALSSIDWLTGHAGILEDVSRSLTLPVYIPSEVAIEHSDWEANQFELPGLVVDPKPETVRAEQ